MKRSEVKWKGEKVGDIVQQQSVTFVPVCVSQRLARGGIEGKKVCFSGQKLSSFMALTDWT